MVESSDKTWSTGEGNGKFNILALRTPWTAWKGKKYDIEKWTLQVVSVQYATGEEWRNNSRKNEEKEPKWKQCPVVGVTGDGSKSAAVKGNIA